MVARSAATHEFATRAMLGALAGLSGSAAMTSAMNRMHGGLPSVLRYPLPPREITERLLGRRSEARARDAAMAAHFAYGGLMGAVYGAVRRRPEPMSGALFGLAVWSASYLGWAPLARILKPADQHPAQRNLLMLAAHVVWGASMAIALRELAHANQESFAGGRLRDAPMRNRRRG